MREVHLGTIRDQMTLETRIIEAFKKVRPVWTPPHATVFKVARRCRRRMITINARDETYWTPARIENMFENFIGNLDELRIETERERFTLIWMDCRKLQRKED